MSNNRHPQKMKCSLTVDRLKEVVLYDANTGQFKWRINLSRKARCGAPAGTKPRNGYQDIRIDGYIYRAHRLAWLYTFGEWPSQQIDHINGDRFDNRLENLRLCTQTENNANRRKDHRNRSGFKGVSFCKTTGLWRATVVHGGKQLTLGRFANPAPAHEAYVVGAKKLFGQFARPE